MYASVAAETWLYATIMGLPEVVATFGEGRFFMDEGTAKETANGRFMTFVRTMALESTPIVRNGGPVSWQFDYDVTGWVDGKDTDPILEAMNAVDLSLEHGTAGVQDGYLVTSLGPVAEIPSAPPARPGEPVASRLGKTYSLFLSRA